MVNSFPEPFLLALVFVLLVGLVDI